MFETFPTKDILKCRLLKNNTIKIAAEPSAWLRVQKKPFPNIFFLFASSGFLKLFHKTDHKIQISTKQLRELYKNYEIFKTIFQTKKMCSKNDVSDCILLNNFLKRNLKPDVGNFFFLKWIFKEAGAAASVARPAEAGTKDNLQAILGLF